MNDEPIPLITYVLVTITSFVLAYASLENDDQLPSNIESDLDNKINEQIPVQQPIQNNDNDSISFNEKQSIQPEVPIVNAVPIESDIIKSGGKKKTKSKNKKLNKSKKKL